MALIEDITTTKTSAGSFASDMIATAKKGMIAITTDDGTGDDHYPLAEGASYRIPAGETLKYWRLTAGSDGGCVLHYMPG